MKNSNEDNTVYFFAREESLKINVNEMNRGKIENIEEIIPSENEAIQPINKEPIAIEPKYVSYTELRRPIEEKPQFTIKNIVNIFKKNRKESPDKKDEKN